MEILAWIYFVRLEKCGRECAHVATSTEEKISWKNTRRNKFNIDQTFSNYLYFFWGVYVSVCARWCYLNIDIRQNESRTHIKHTHTQFAYIYLHTEQKQAEQNTWSAHTTTTATATATSTDWIQTSFKITMFIPLFSTRWFARRRGKKGIVFIASWHTDDLENLQQYKFYQPFAATN